MPRGDSVGLLLILPPLVADCLSGSFREGSGRGRVRIVFLGGLIIAGGFFASGYAALFTNLRTARIAAGERLFSLGELQAEELKEHLRDLELYASSLGTRDPAGRRSLVSWAEEGDARPPVPEVDLRLRSMVGSGVVDSILITDGAGAIVYPEGGGRVEGIMSAAGRFDPASGRAFVGMVNEPSLGGLRYGWAQCLGHSGLTVFLLRDPYIYVYGKLLSSWPIPTETGESFLMERSAGGILYLSPLRFDSAPPLTLRRPEADREARNLEGLDAENGLYEALDYRGRSVIAHRIAIPGTGWDLVVKMDSWEALSEYRKLLMGFLQALGSGLVLILFSAAVALRRERTRQEMDRLQDRAEKGWLMEAIDHGSEGFFILSLPERRILYLNAVAKTLLRNGAELAIGHPFPDEALVLDSGRKLADLIDTAAEPEGWSETVRGRLSDADGPEIAVELKLDAVDYRGGKALLMQIKDISEHLIAESEREASLRFMGILNQAGDMDSLMDGLLSYLRSWSGCEAVGIRVRDGDDFPYYTQAGFDEGFILAERSLCEHDSSGHILRDSEGNPVLECMCGNIIRGRFDPSLPFFTEAGSFWSNCTSELLASTSEEDRQARTRNRCNGEGYESVALIPLHSGSETFGLIQLNDRRKNRFSQRFIQLMERLASDVAQGIRAIRVKESLERSEAKYRSLFTSMDFGFALHQIILDGEGRPVDYRFLEINPAFERLTGLKAAGLLGHTVLEAMPQTESYWIESYGRIALEGGTLRMENYSKELGKHFEVTAYSPEPGFFAVLVADVSERRRIELELVEAKEKAAAILASVGEGVIATDVLGAVMAMNGAAEELCGWTEAEALGRSVEDVFVLKDGAEGRAEGGKIPLDIPGLIEKRRVRMSLEAWLRDRSGRSFPISYSAAPIMDGQGSTGGLVLSFRDISESLLLQNASLRAEKLEALGTMAGGIAHDFNNLLGGLFGYLDIARQEIDPASPVTALLEKAVGVFNRARDLSLQLLTFSKGGAAKKKPGYPAQVARECAAFSLSGSKIRLILDLPEDLWPCDYDANQFQQVIQNLVINAKQAMPEGGTLRLSGANRAYPEGGPGALAPGNYLELRVSDNGPGIPAEIMGKIFDPFFTTKKEGSGLGLATCYSIMERHGGKISAESELGAGTSFILVLPAKPGAMVEEARQAATSFRGKGRILLMDDEDCILDVLSTMLEGLGFSCETVSEGSQALSLAQAAAAEGRPYSAAFLDLTIPNGLGGLAIVGALKEALAGAPVIASSGYSDDPVMSDPVKFGFDGALMKPYLRAGLIALLSEFMKG